jgi:GDP-D-mannose dehydratase
VIHSNFIIRIIKVQSDKFYNLSGMINVKVSFGLIVYVTNVYGIGILRILEDVRVSVQVVLCLIYCLRMNE